MKKYSPWLVSCVKSRKPCALSHATTFTGEAPVFQLENWGNSYVSSRLRSGVFIGNRMLAKYTYSERNNFLERLDYGNGDRVQYEYDKQGRVTSQTYEDGDTVTYRYDNNGALASVTDSATGRTLSEVCVQR